MSQATAPKYDLVLKGGRVIDERNGRDGRFDVAIARGKIAAIALSIDADGARVRDVTGYIVSPGLIDIHTHVYHKATSLSVDPGLVARRSAITTLIDAGSAITGAAIPVDCGLTAGNIVMARELTLEDF